MERGEGEGGRRETWNDVERVKGNGYRRDGRSQSTHGIRQI